MQLHMRSFNDGDELTIEPFRADAFPVIKDLIVDRSALDKIVSSGGYVSVKTEAHRSLRDSNRKEFCRCGNGCGGALDVVRVAACPNGAAMLFTSAKFLSLRYCRRGP